MNTEKDIILEEMRKSILFACVESFGISHQIPYVEFRNDGGYDFTIQIECSILLKGIQELSESESVKNFLIFMSECNLEEVVGLEILNQNDLLLIFKGGSELMLINKNDIDEPWSFFSSEKSTEDSLSIIAINSTGFAMWKGSPQTGRV